MHDPDEDHDRIGYWPSVTDLFMTLFVISIVILAVVFYTLLPKNNIAIQRPIIEAVGIDLRHVREPVNLLREKLALPPISENTLPAGVIASLKETCDSAVLKIEELEKELKELQSSDHGAMLAKLQKEKAALIKQVEDLTNEVARLRRILVSLEALDLEDLIAENKALKKQLHDKPPIIRIDEQKEAYRFLSGSSVIGEDFADGLKDNEFTRLAKEIVDRQAEGRVKVDTLEIIGHTDGRPISSTGNLDRTLPDLLAGSAKAFGVLKPGSNNDLGLLRALAVKLQWEAYIAQHEEKKVLQGLSVRCYSAGQTILPVPAENPKPAAFMRDDPRARRIEMRLTRLN